MTIALGAHAVVANPAGVNVTTLTTPSKTTSASGSTFVISVLAGTTIAAVTPVVDSFGNTYTLKASQLSFYFSALWEYMYVCDGGSGGVGHTATANLSGAAGMAVFFNEITGAASPSYDTSGTVYTGNGNVASASGASVTTGNANDLILSIYAQYPGGASTVTDTGGWNGLIDISDNTNNAQIFQAFNSYTVVSSTGTYADTYAFSPNSTGGGVAIAFKAAAAVPASVRQACTGWSASSIVASQSAKFTEATLAGSTIFVVAVGSSPLTFADDANGTYLELDGITDLTTGSFSRSFYLPNAGAISTSQNVTVTPLIAQANLGLVAYEITGVGADSLTGHAANLQTVASAAADAIKSPMVNIGAGAAIGVAVCTSTTINGSAPYFPLTGTNFSICPTPGDNFFPLSSNKLATGQYQSYASPAGDQAATFAAPSATSNNYATFFAGFAAVTPQNPLPWQNLGAMSSVMAQ